MEKENEEAGTAPPSPQAPAEGDAAPPADSGSASAMQRTSQVEARTSQIGSPASKGQVSAKPSRRGSKASAAQISTKASLAASPQKSQIGAEQVETTPPSPTAEQPAEQPAEEPPAEAPPAEE